MNGTTTQPLLLPAPQPQLVTIGYSITRPDKRVQIQLQNVMAKIRNCRYHIRRTAPVHPSAKGGLSRLDQT